MSEVIAELAMEASDKAVEIARTQECVTYHCECGHELGGYMTAELPFPHTYNEDEPPNFCPNCGRRIVEPTTNDVDAEVDA